MSNCKYRQDPLEIYIDNKRILRRSEVQRLLGISRSTLYRWIEKGIFPPPVNQHGAIAFWHKEDYDDWLAKHHK